MAVNEALSNAGSLEIDMVNAQQAWRVLDRLVGYQVSPVL
jgi:DNA topoisomerase-1